LVRGAARILPIYYTPFTNSHSPAS